MIKIVTNFCVNKKNSKGLQERNNSSFSRKDIVANLVYSSSQLAQVHCIWQIFFGHCLPNTGRARLIRSHSLARISFKLSGNSN